MPPNHCAFIIAIELLQAKIMKRNVYFIQDVPLSIGYQIQTFCGIQIGSHSIPISN